MYSLARFSLLEMTECSAVLRQLGEQSRSLQEAASKAVNYLFDTLGDPATGQRDCVLVRCFKTISYSRLDAEHQQLVREKLGGIAPFPDLRCFTLVASTGAEPDWNRVDRSHRYRVIPMVSADFVKQFPMFSQLLHQFGVSTEFDVRPDGEWLVDLEEKTYNVFYVPDAAGSPYVPVQDGFVGKYGVKSVLCFGGMLPSRDLFAVILFSKTSVPRETAALCKSLALSLKTSLLAFDEAFRTDSGASQQSGSAPEPPASLRHQSRLAVAEQLLRVYEDAVRTQSAGIAQAKQALHDRAIALQRSEQALHEQTRIVNSVLRSMGDGVVVTDAYRSIAGPTGRGLTFRRLYTDGLTTMFTFGGIYAAGTFGWGALDMLAYGIFLSVFAVFGGVFGGWLDDNFGSRNAILISIGGTSVGLVLTLLMGPASILGIWNYPPDAVPVLYDGPFFNTVPEAIYVALVIIIAIFITAAYANSRTMLARIAPTTKMTEFFGLYALSGTATAFMAPFVVGQFTSGFHSQAAGMASILIFLAIGLVMMLFVTNERAVARD